jgi:polygalacturonase
MTGVILKNSGNWFMPISFSDRVTVTNLKILGYRANADGIDIYSSRDVTVQGCFVRTVDDLIAIKSRIRTGNVVTDSDKVRNVVVRGNRFWNETGTAMQIGTEVGPDISSVSFVNNEVIRDLARGTSEGIYLSGSGTVSNVQFEGNKIDRTGNQFDTGGASRVIYAFIRHSLWEAAADKTRPLGKIRDIQFSDTTVTTSPENPKLLIQLEGVSESSDIEDVRFSNVTVNGKPLSKANAVVEEKFATKITGLP